MFRIFEDKKETAQALKDLSSTLAFCGEHDWPKIIAASLFEHLPEQSSDWIEYLIQGMQAKEYGEPFSPQRFNDTFSEYLAIERALKNKENLNSAELFFDALAEQKDLISLIPGKLYYRVSKTGYGKNIQVNSVVRLNYTVTDHFGECLGTAKEADPIHLSDLLPGVYVAMIGMNVGEEREVFIHPALAYGETSNLEPNLALTMRVKLVEIVSQLEKASEVTLCPLALAASSVSNIELQKKIQTLKQRVAFQLGQKIWTHFMKGQQEGYSIDSVTQALRKMQNKELQTESLSLNNELLTQLHWKLYELYR